MKISRWFLAVSAPFLLLACELQTKVDVFEKVEQQLWSYNDVKSIEVAVDDTTQFYNLYLNIRHAGDYEWQNLYVRLQIFSPKGDSSTFLVNVPLSGPDGKWNGSGLGDVLTLRHLFKSQVQFKQMGVYQFKIEQFMRVNPLAGVHDIGLRVKAINE